ncbi:hypothetical protein HZS_1499 [Henneguya salminicola]|nr:hypothetical protein HZS_1499 [Henneguya salminicola]
MHNIKLFALTNISNGWTGTIAIKLANIKDGFDLKLQNHNISALMILLLGLGNKRKLHFFFKKK